MRAEDQVKDFKKSIDDTDAASLDMTASLLPADDPLVVFCREWHIEDRDGSVAGFLWDRALGFPFCFNFMKVKAKHLLDMKLDNPDDSMDASIDVWVSNNQLEAFIAIYPPINGGADVTEDMIKDFLAAHDITEGIDEELIAELAEKKAYLKIARAAAGMAPEHGENGSYTQLVSLEDAEKDENAKIDYKELNWILNVQQGQNVCEITPPTTGRDGISVKGAVLPAKPGRPVPFLAGKNTKYTDDGKYVYAEKDGQLIFNGNRYTVNEVLTIRGNVDYSTGNITSNGTVVIYGDVRPTFCVEAKQDIIVHGIVEGGTLIAGGDIKVSGGVIASKKGELVAKGDIHCKFMEYGVAYAYGNAYFENLILSEVNCEGDIYVTSGRGGVIGGSLLAMGKIQVTMLGNRAYCVTKAAIGCTKRFLEQKQKLVMEIDAVYKNQKKAEENISKLSEANNPQTEPIIKQIEATLPALKMKLENLQSKFKALEEQEAQIVKNRIYVDRAFPNVTVKIKDTALKLDKEEKYCSFHLSGGRMVSAPR